MCRWLGYSGTPVYLEELILEPDHSLIDQSLKARTGPDTTNGDGFGVGWYGDREGPGLYRDIQPAWNNSNLRDLCAHVKSPLFLAHIRAATGTAIQQTNCHPFRHRNWLFVHNGLIGGFERIKRDLALEIAPELYPMILGTTDSELMFYLAQSFGLEENPLTALERMVGFVERVCAGEGIEDAVQLSVGLSDGERLYAARYSTEGRSRTLFHSKNMEALREIHPDLQRFSPQARAVVSEPLNELTGLWQEIPESTAIAVYQGEVERFGFKPRLPD